jgi:ankyrin repeat protein
MDIVGHLGEIGLEAHLRYRNSRGENVLHLASKLCNPDMFRLLLPQFPKCIYAEDDIGETPLLLVIMSPSAKRYQPLCDNTFAYKRQPRNLMFGLARARLADYCVAS